MTSAGNRLEFTRELAADFSNQANLVDFALAELTPQIVHLVRSPIEIWLTLDRYAFELEAGVARSGGGLLVPAADVARCFSIKPEIGLQNVHNAAELRQGVQRLAELLRESMLQIAGDPDCWLRRLEECRDAHARVEAQSRNLNRAVGDAKAAWERGDFATVVRLYEPIAASLSPAERQRLHIAKGGIGDG